MNIKELVKNRLIIEKTQYFMTVKIYDLDKKEKVISKDIILVKQLFLNSIKDKKEYTDNSSTDYITMRYAGDLILITIRMLTLDSENNLNGKQYKYEISRTELIDFIDSDKKNQNLKNFKNKCKISNFLRSNVIKDIIKDKIKFKEFLIMINFKMRNSKSLSLYNDFNGIGFATQSKYGFSISGCLCWDKDERVWRSHT